MTSNDLHLPAQLAAAQRRFEHWRSTRTKLCKIPTPLWNTAVRCAAKYGVYRTVLALGLDYKTLKKRLLASTGALATPSHPAFVELVPPERNGPAECIVEVERPEGAKLRVELRGTAIPDIPELARRFAAEGV
jgi:hypothetical protein